MSKQVFTLEEANQLLPFIEKELNLLQALKYEFDRKQTDLEYSKRFIMNNGNTAPGNMDPFFTLECELEFLHIQTRLHIHNIQSTGALIKDIDYGLIDFPGLVDNQSVLWCWKLGENKISHYHGLKEGFEGRKKWGDDSAH
jgi:hypothetical protein